MKSFAIWVGKAIEALVVLILSAMSILVFLNVVLRYGFNSSINVTEEVSRYMFVWLAFLGTILAFNENQHVNVGVLVDKLSPKKRNILGIVTDLAMLYCSYLIIDGGWIQYVLNLDNYAPISGLPQGITFLASVIAGALMGVLLIARLVSRVSLLVKGEQ
ncbi:TRAP transporter small permease [[Pasteurella] aerogenes]